MSRHQRRRQVTLDPTPLTPCNGNKFDQELQDKQKLYLGVFLRNCNLRDADLGRSHNCVLKGEERDRVYEDRKKRGFQRDYTSYVERAVIDAG